MEKRVLAGRAWPAGSGAGEGLPLPWVAGGTGPGAFLERGGTAQHGTARRLACSLLEWCPLAARRVCWLLSCVGFPKQPYEVGLKTTSRCAHCGASVMQSLGKVFYF